MTPHTSVQVTRCTAHLKAVLEKVTLDGRVWYDTMDMCVEAEVKLLRIAGAIAHHPVVHTLVRFEE